MKSFRSAATAEVRRAIDACTIAGLASVVAISLVSPAQAVVRLATYSGQLSRGMDQAGFFGPANASLNGVAYSVTYTYDTALGARTTDSGVTDDIRGGYGYGGASVPITDAALTINGVTVHITPNDSVYDNAYAFTQHGFIDEGYPQQDFVKHGVTSVEKVDHAVTVGDYAYSFATLAEAPGSLDDELLPTPGAQNFQGFDFMIYRYDIVSKTVSIAYGSHAALEPGIYPALTYSVTSPMGGGGGADGTVPEPATWAMMVFGFGVAGAAARRARHKRCTIQR